MFDLVDIQSSNKIYLMGVSDLHLAGPVLHPSRTYGTYVEDEAWSKNHEMGYES